jgi:hypothetical protein
MSEDFHFTFDFVSVYVSVWVYSDRQLTYEFVDTVKTAYRKTSVHGRYMLVIF